MMRAYVVGQKVLANCGTSKKPDWIPGEVIDREIAPKPCLVRLIEESDGRLEWWFPESFIMQDNARNRKRHGVSDAK